MFYLYKENIAPQKLVHKEYCQHLLYHIYSFSAFLVPDVQMEDIAEIICQLSTILFKINEIKFSKNYVSTIGIFFRRCIFMDEE